jgi:hypothetical protein
MDGKSVGSAVLQSCDFQFIGGPHRAGHAAVETSTSVLRFYFLLHFSSKPAYHRIGFHGHDSFLFDVDIQYGDRDDDGSDCPFRHPEPGGSFWTEGSAWIYGQFAARALPMQPASAGSQPWLEHRPIYPLPDLCHRFFRRQPDIAFATWFRFAFPCQHHLSIQCLACFADAIGRSRWHIEKSLFREEYAELGKMGREEKMVCWCLLA